MRNVVTFLILTTWATTAPASETAFGKGPVFNDYGPVAVVDVTMPVDPDMELKHSFDVSAPAVDGKPNSTLVSAARFINMHAATGIAEDNIQVAVVVHGKATMEMADENSTSADLIAALTKHNVRIIVCGQSAAYYDVATDDLLPGVEMALSAMTAHAVLQQQGYTVNPF
ncbi:MAG: DsrE family protein [Gammaproteobacteria bacterium]|nr:DsrE family protein [Gammaproteobacteria bacterium]